MLEDYAKIQKLRDLVAVEGYVAALICETGARKIAALRTDIESKLGKSLNAGELQTASRGLALVFRKRFGRLKGALRGRGDGEPGG